jgi:hypothetical protein
MPQFSKRFSTKWGISNFYFNGIFTVEGLRYHISTIDKDRKAIMFYMEPNENKWQVVDRENYPDWILILEEELSEAIKKNNHN